MPKYHSLEVSGGDRNSLIRFAVVARLIDLPDTESTKRGSPKLPESMLEGLGFKNQRHFTRYVYAGSLLDGDAQRLLESIDRLTPREEGLADLRRSFLAAQNPAEVASGISEQFWPILRTIPVSRHPIDAIISAGAAINYFQHSEPTFRDSTVLRRLQKNLCRIAVGGYPMSARAVDLIAILSRWEMSTPIDEIRNGDRRIARALDRTLRSYVRRDVWGPRPVQMELPELELAAIPRQDVPVQESSVERDGTLELSANEIISDQRPVADDPESSFRKIFLEVAKRMNTSILNAPHTPTSSSSPALRLARVVIRYHDPSDEEEHAIAVNMAMVLQDVALDRRRSNRDADMPDVLLRREAFLYLLEAYEFLDENASKGLAGMREVLRRMEQAPAEFQDLIEFARSFLASERPQRAATDHSVLLRDDQLSVDLVASESLSAASWPLVASLGEALWPHLPLGDSLPSSTEWRQLTKQIALPTRDLLYEVLTTPASGRARTIADTFRHAGATVRESVTAVLVKILNDERLILQHTAVARRAAWTIGFSGLYSKDVGLTLTRLALRNDVHYALSADAAWALGDVLVGTRGTGAEPALAALTRIATTTMSDIQALGASADPILVSKRLIRTQAALHALAIQRRGQYATLFASLVEQWRAETVPAPADKHLGRANYIAQWGIDLVDSPPALALALSE